MSTKNKETVLVLNVSQNGDITVKMFEVTPDTKRVLVKSGRVFFTHDDEDKLISHISLKIAVLDSTNNSAIANFNEMIEFFGTGWVLKFLRGELEKTEKFDVADTDKWKGFLKRYVEKYEDVDLSVELDYVQSALNVANSQHTIEIVGVDLDSLKSLQQCLQKPGTQNSEVIGSIRTNPQILHKIAQQIGKEYDATLMMDSAENEKILARFDIHTALYDVLHKYGLGKAVKEAINISKNDITKVLKPETKKSKKKTVKSSEYNKTMNSDQLLAGVLSGVIFVDELSKSQKKDFDSRTSEIADLIPEQIEKNIYRELIERLIPLFSKANLSRVVSGEYDFEAEDFKELDLIDEPEAKGVTSFSEMLPYFEDFYTNYDAATKGRVSYIKEKREKEKKTKKEKTKGGREIDSEPEPWEYSLVSLIADLKTNSDTIESNGKLSPGSFAKIAKQIQELFIVKNDYTKNIGLEKAIAEKKSKTTMRLRPWQLKLVKLISSGKSGIAIGPTSGGKTLTSMFALDNLFRNKPELSLVYVAPNFYQALQAYLNIVKSFPTKKIGFISGVINVTPKDCKVWVGTPSELLVFAKARQMMFDTGIFDEIHTISTSYGTGFEAGIRATALTQLIGYIRLQFIALSATIHVPDLEILMSKVEELSDNRFKMEDPIIYTERPVPLKHFMWDDKSVTPIEITNNPKDTIKTFVEVTPKSTFKLMRELKEKKQTPALIFDTEESTSYNFFNELVAFLKNKFNKEYAKWNNMNTKWAIDVENFNEDASQVRYEMNQDGGENAGLMQKNFAKIGEKRKKLVKEMLEDLQRTTILSLGFRPIRVKKVVDLPEGEEEVKEEINFARSPGAVKRVKIVADADKLVVVKDLDYKVREVLKAAALASKNSLPDLISPQSMDLAKEYLRFSKESRGENSTNIPDICVGMGTYYKLNDSPINTIFKDMIKPTPESTVEYNFMASLTEAEGARASDVNNIFKLMDLALNFGIGILLPTMPFGVQYQILKMLDQRKLAFVFVSMSMSMGVNYPARTVVVRSPEVKPLNICEATQAIGRGGRWGLIKDPFALAITWNVENAKSISSEMLPPIEYPVITKDNTGSILTNPEKVAMEIGRIMLTVDNQESLRYASNAMNQFHKRIESKKHEGSINIGSEEGELAPRRVEKTEEKKEVQSYEGITSDPTLVTSIITCVQSIGESASLDEDMIRDLKLRLQDVCTGGDCDISGDAYYWAEQINIIGRGLQELHATYHVRSCTSLLTYIASLFDLIHRANMRHIGGAYDPSK
jgi:hypothetical protein